MKRTKRDLWWLLFWASMPLWLCGGFFAIVARLPEQPPTAHDPHYLLVHALERIQKSGIEGPQYIQSGTEAQFGKVKITVDVKTHTVNLSGDPETVHRAYEALRP